MWKYAIFYRKKIPSNGFRNRMLRFLEEAFWATDTPTFRLQYGDSRTPSGAGRW